MEPLMYAAIKEMVKNQRIDTLVSNPVEKRKRWRERINCFGLREDGELTWNGYRVPTTELVMKVLLGEHVTEKGHIRDVATLRKYLVDKGFVLPPFIGGLERAVNV